MTSLSTLCYIEKDGKYLMLHRTVKKNDVNKDKWIGVGGHFEADESPEECVLREVKEETGYTLTSYRYRGLVTFVSGNGVTEYMSLFTADGFEGEPIACDEGELRWVDKKEINHLNLWEGDKIFFQLLDEEVPFFSLKLVYDGHDKLVDAQLNGKKMECAGKKYRFFGWETANAQAVNKEYPHIRTPWDLYDALSGIWCADTCAPRIRDKWTKENMTCGQCSITAFLAQDIFGGKVYGVPLPDGNFHCYNVVGNCVFDLTSEQFGDEKLKYADNPEQFREVHFAKEEKRLRYEYLKERLKEYSKNIIK